MKKLLLTSVSAFALAGSAFGADMAPMFKAPPPPSYTWAGFYLGIDGGVARHDVSFNDLSGLVSTLGTTFSASKTGGVLGGYAGFNVQDRSFVYGLEADVNWVGAKETETWGGTFNFSNSSVQSQDTPWVATFRGRMGLDYESTLIYLTGGLAVAQVKNNFTTFCNFCFGFPGAVPFASYDDSKTRLGWTAGVGVEHMFSNHWTLRGEFRYVDLGRTAVGCTALVAGGPCNAPGATYRGEFSNILMNGLVGIGYKF
jgi:outer membrane immunogenic protein